MLVATKYYVTGIKKKKEANSIPIHSNCTKSSCSDYSMGKKRLKGKKKKAKGQKKG